MKIKAFIEQGSDGSYGIYLDDNDANILIIGEGNTLAEAKEDFFVCRNEMKAYYEEQGRVFPDLEFVFQYDSSFKASQTSLSCEKESEILEYA